MAEVFRAKPFDAPNFRGYLALKRILPHLAEDEQFIKMFIDEARLTVQLAHPNIVRIYELGRFQSSYYILMEFIGGRDVLSVQKRMRKNREIIGVEQACFIAREMARGLDFAHHRTDADGNPLNIIHRDVSPQNVLVDYDGRVKVIDFGIAKAAVRSTRTQIGVLKGKMGYMSPEQVSGLDLDARSDIFAIGTVLWEMLTNRRLFTGDNEFATMQKVKEARVVPPSTYNPRVPIEVDQIVLGAMSVDPADRPQRAGVLARQLDAFLQGRDYRQEQLAEWMREVFADELAEEEEKRESFARIQTPDDVVRATIEDARQNPPTAVSGEAVVDDTKPMAKSKAESAAAVEDHTDKTTVWAADVAPDEDVDPLAFGAEHTVVQAGGFDPAAIEEEERKGRDPRFSEELQRPFGSSLVSDKDFESESTSTGETIAPRRRPRGAPIGLAVLASALLVVGAFAAWSTFDRGRAEGASSPNAPVAQAPPEPAVEPVPPPQEELEARLSLQLAEEPEGLRLFLDGEEVSSQQASEGWTLPVGPHLVEALAPGRRPYRRIIDLEPEAGDPVAVALPELAYELTVDGPEGAVLSLDGEEIGALPRSLDVRDPGVVHNLELRPADGEPWRSVLAFPWLAQGRLDLGPEGQPDALEEGELGWLTVTTGEDWWAVLVDGVDTGMVTPITGEQRLAVAPGDRRITLQRGRRRHEMELDFRPGETIVIRQQLPFEWSEDDEVGRGSAELDGRAP